MEAIYGKSHPEAESEAVTFDDTQVSSPEQIANYFNRQFTSSKHGRHTSSLETRIVSREIKRKSLMSAVTFATDQVIKGVHNCSNAKAFGSDRLSVFHLENIGPRAFEYLTALFNDSVTSCRIPAIWMSSIVIPIPKLSHYIRGGQSVTSCRGVMSKARIIHTGVSQGSKLLRTLFSLYIADMPRPTEPVKRICYADDITVWAFGLEISELEHKVNTYLKEMSRFLWENSPLISAPKSSVDLFTPDPAQANTHPKIKIADSELPLVRIPKLLGVYLDTFFSFNKHCAQVANRVSKINNVFNALASTN